MAWLFNSSVKADIILDDVQDRKVAEVQTDKGIQRYYVYEGNEPVKGKISLKLAKGVKKLEHQGIHVNFIGQIELFYDRGSHFQFISLTKQLESPGSLTSSKIYDFNFDTEEKTKESYYGKNARLRYFVKFVVVRSFLPNIVKEQDIWVINYDQPPEIDKPIKMEVGIEECLHIEFEYTKRKYHLEDVVIGKVYFLLVRINIKYMEIALIRRETTGTGVNAFSEDEKLTKFEIMDGVPVRGESIPVRLFLGNFNLTPSYTNVHGKFTVKYLLNIVLVDEEDRRYYKQQEIFLWRRKPGTHLELDEGKHNARHFGPRDNEREQEEKEIEEKERQEENE